MSSKATSNLPGPTLDQRRAGHAWNAVARVKKDTKNAQGSYRREAKRLPVRILTAGLGHALSFVQTKGGDAEILLRDIADWVLDKRRQPSSSAKRPDADALIRQIIAGNGTDLQIFAAETLSYLEWLTRFAEAALEDDELGTSRAS